jgi:hypothetical protein
MNNTSCHGLPFTTIPPSPAAAIAGLQFYIVPNATASLSEERQWNDDQRLDRIVQFNPNFFI